MIYALDNCTTSFRVLPFETVDAMEESVGYMAFEPTIVGEPEMICLANPTAEQVKVLELAMHMMTIQFYFPGELNGYYFYIGERGDHAAKYKDCYAPVYNCLKNGRLMDARDHRVLVDKFLELPPLSSLCDGDIESRDFKVFKRLIDAMLDFIEVGRYVPEQTEWVDDIPF